ncbi:Uncharacterized protein PECH_005473 [Penicillium ucsense]|uniref:SUN domain-containing protein n=1 Tax=Penicillium ucsense TaxID=2839758 RepID=A0A8J8W8A3_9EURO|nr:Uncharacterized protein PECM_005502 [Penicillium ucsense]KAF7736240.1 Uncharacterized protein PECH_005473 [Penicillium ucsense]
MTRRLWPTWLQYVAVMMALSAATCGDGVQNATRWHGETISSRDNGLARSPWQAEAALFQYPTCIANDAGAQNAQSDRHRRHSNLAQHMVKNETGAMTGTVSAGVTAGTPSSAGGPDADSEADTDSLLDSSSFLSFEDWKKQNLAKAGQSADNVGGSRRAAAVGKEGRRQPGINNALDSLGDDAEIELDFVGFVAESPEASPTAWGTPIPSQSAAPAKTEDNEDALTLSPPQPDRSRRKDAGTTCKERFNYASFDCAATVLKTNPECKGSSAVLVENKDSYMLNECRAKNKFLILELCDDILVDTVVLANYEFFSSIFHTFRVSVSDRYPAKPDQWKELGVFEARNTREVQAFAVENSLIWARYLRVEFLTHYGHEFYCPISLIRVHGTTMMEEYKHDESVSRGETEFDEEVSEIADGTEPVDALPFETPMEEFVAVSSRQEASNQLCPNPLAEVLLHLSANATFCPVTGICAITEKTPDRSASHVELDRHIEKAVNASSTAVPGEGASTASSRPLPPPKAPKVPEGQQRSGAQHKSAMSPPKVTVAAPDHSAQDSKTENTGKATTYTRDEQTNGVGSEQARPSSTQPPPSIPTTQESFFKSVHKRLQMLESNSTLSLLYIEEQSRILRDAFSKVEKRQLAKTSTFLENLNSTVLNELKEFREQYDHVWKSVAFEFEHQRVRYHQEVQSLSGQLGVLADELVFQKRVIMIQSIMVLCCFAVVLFSRGSVGNYMEFPRVQRMVARSYSLRSTSPPFETPTASPSSPRAPSSYQEHPVHRRALSDSSMSPEGSNSPDVTYVPPTPPSEVTPEFAEVDDEKRRKSPSPELMSVPTLGSPHFRSHSTPPVLNSLASQSSLRAEDEDEDVMYTSSSASDANGREN